MKLYYSAMSNMFPYCKELNAISLNSQVFFEQCCSLIRKTVNAFVFGVSFVFVFVFSVSFVVVFVSCVSLYLYFCFIVHTVWFSPEAVPQSGQKDCQCLWVRFDPYWQNAEDGSKKRPKELCTFHVFVFVWLILSQTMSNGNPGLYSSQISGIFTLV